MERFKLILGDWSDDGHGKTETFIVESNKPVDEAREAYFEAVKKTGIDFGEQVCRDYEDNTWTL